MSQLSQIIGGSSNSSSGEAYVLKHFLKSSFILLAMFFCFCLKEKKKTTNKKLLTKAPSTAAARLHPLSLPLLRPNLPWRFFFLRSTLQSQQPSQEDWREPPFGPMCMMEKRTKGHNTFCSHICSTITTTNPHTSPQTSTSEDLPSTHKTADTYKELILDNNQSSMDDDCLSDTSKIR